MKGKARVLLALLIVLAAGGCAAGWFLLSGDNSGETSAAEASAEMSEEESSEDSDSEADAEGEAESSAEEAESEEAKSTVEEAKSESESESEEEPELTASEQAQIILAQMTLYEKVCQLFIVTPEQLTGFDGTVTQAGETTRAALESTPVGGIIYFAANIQTRSQCSTMLANSQSYAKYGLFLAVDEEGGTVARVGSNSAMGTTSFPSMSVIGDTGDPLAAYNVGYTIGTELTELGFNLDFAPVADVNTNPENTVIGDRAFSSDAETAAEMVAACVSGFRESGMLCTLKHFPGHGDTSTDSHTGTTYSYQTLEELMSCELLPFQAGIEAGADFVMMGHITLSNVSDDGLPASLSYDIITGLLRETLGYDGIVITDAMNMAAITDNWSSGNAAVKAIQAGADMILMPYSLSGALEGVLEAVESGNLTEERIDESVLRILTVKLESGILDFEEFQGSQES